jgi:hypothetical protein
MNRNRFEGMGIMLWSRMLFSTLLALMFCCGGKSDLTEQDHWDGSSTVQDAGSDFGQEDIPVEPDMNAETPIDASFPDMDDAIDNPVDVHVDADDGVDLPLDTDPDISDIRSEEECIGGAVGDACSLDSQCGCVPSSARECLTSISGYMNFPGGYCTARCTSAAECGSGANCAEITPGTMYCLKLCTNASQCRMAEDYTCTSIPMSSDTRTYCLPRFGNAERE